MVLFNYALKELTAKIVYYGPGLSGKTTNLQYIYEELPIKNKGRMLTLATETDRTLYFDFLPVDAGIVRGIKTRVQLYTVPGQVFYNATRRMVLKGADGVVFVADSQRSMVEANLESFENLRENLRAHDLDVEEMPIVLQFNKRDLEDVATAEEMNDALNALNAPFYEAVAKDGIGVEETLQAISGLVLKSVIDRYGGERSMGKLGRPLASDPARTDPARTDPARTDPDALVSASVGRGGGSEVAASEAESQNVASQSAAPNIQAKAGPWAAGSEEDNVASSKEDSMDAFQGFNIEGILDEALRLDDGGVPPVDRPANASGAEPPTSNVENDFAEEESMFSGLLDEALGARETESIFEEALGPSSTSESTSTPSSLPSSDEEDGEGSIEFEVDFLEDSLEPVEAPDPLGGQGGARASSVLSELIKTRVSIPKDPATTGPPRKGEASEPPPRVEVPVTLHVDPEILDGDIELVLKIRFKRK